MINLSDSTDFRILADEISKSVALSKDKNKPYLLNDKSLTEEELLNEIAKAIVAAKTFTNVNNAGALATKVALAIANILIFIVKQKIKIN